jgi:hypothetical protein
MEGLKNTGLILLSTLMLNGCSLKDPPAFRATEKNCAKVSAILNDPNSNTMLKRANKNQWKGSTGMNEGVLLKRCADCAEKFGTTEYDCSLK